MIHKPKKHRVPNRLAQFRRIMGNTAIPVYEIVNTSQKRLEEVGVISLFRAAPQNRRSELKILAASLSKSGPPLWRLITPLLISINYHEGNEYNDNSDARRGEWTCIPLPNTEFIGGMLKVMDLNPNAKTFVDAGAGLGAKMEIASKLFDLNASGFEISKDNIRKCKWRLKNGLHLQDITTADYSGFDIIYAYSPIMTRAGMRRFHQAVLKTAKIGALCFILDIEHAIDKFTNPKLERYYKEVGSNIYEIAEGVRDGRKNSN